MPPGHFQNGGVLVASGHDLVGSWKLYVTRGADDLIEGRAQTVEPGGSGGSAGCWGFGLPLGFNEEDASSSEIKSFRTVHGAVTLGATLVRINLANGGHADLTPQGASAGFGRAFYMGHVEGSISDIEAFDAHGTLVGRTTPDPPD